MSSNRTSEPHLSLFPFPPPLSLSFPPPPHLSFPPPPPLSLSYLTLAKRHELSAGTTLPKKEKKKNMKRNHRTFAMTVRLKQRQKKWKKFSWHVPRRLMPLIWKTSFISQNDSKNNNKQQNDSNNNNNNKNNNKQFNSCLLSLQRASWPCHGLVMCLPWWGCRRWVVITSARGQGPKFTTSSGTRRLLLFHDDGVSTSKIEARKRSRCIRNM